MSYFNGRLRARNWFRLPVTRLMAVISIMATGCGWETQTENAETSIASSQSSGAGTQSSTQTASAGSDATEQPTVDAPVAVLKREDSLPKTSDLPTAAEQSASLKAKSPEQHIDSARQALQELREANEKYFINPFKFSPEPDEKLLEAVEFTDEQIPLFREAGKKIAENRQARVDLKDELYPNDRMDYYRDDTPANKARFTELDRSFLQIAKQAGEQIFRQLSDEQKRDLLIHEKGRDAIFAPVVHKAVGITEEQILRTALNVKAAGVAYEAYNTSTGDSKYSGEGLNEFRRLHHRHMEAYWTEINDEQPAALRKLGVKEAVRRVLPQWLAPTGMLADLVDAEIRPRADASIRQPVRLVIIRGLVRVAAQQGQLENARICEGHPQRNCELWDLTVERQERAIGAEDWNAWSEVEIADYLELLQECDFAPNATALALHDDVITAPLPALKSGSWEAVTGHPEGDSASGLSLLRFVDLNAKAGNEYRYRARVEWRVRSGPPRNETPYGGEGYPGTEPARNPFARANEEEATSQLSPFSDPTEPIAVSE